jgi:hypothetical protein
MCPVLFVQVPDVNGILDRLLLFLGYEKDYVTAETLVQVRRHCELAQQLTMFTGMCAPVLGCGWVGMCSLLCGLVMDYGPAPPGPPHTKPNPCPHPACLPARCLQMTDVLRRYPDAAEACVETIAAIPEDVGTPAAALWFFCLPCARLCAWLHAYALVSLCRPFCIPGCPPCSDLPCCR